MKEAGVAPPGVMPIQQPTMQLRIDVTQYLSSSFQVCSTAPRRILAVVPENLRPLSMEERISPIPNRPITAIRKSKPTSNSVWPKVMRKVPVILSRPTAPRQKPRHIAARTLKGEPLPMPTKLANVRKNTEKNSAGPNCRANLATSGARKVIRITATRAPTNEEVKAAVKASSARPCWAMGWPSKVVATDQGSPGILNRMEVMAPPNRAPQ